MNASDGLDQPIFDARLEPAGTHFAAPARLTLLQGALRAGIELPSSCRNGTCRTCMCRLLDGQIAYAIEWPGLSAEEKREGFILPCVAYPASNVAIEPVNPWNASF